MSDRISDLEHSDALSEMRDRTYALECAIAGAASLTGIDRAGLLQFADDVARAMTRLKDAFEAERQMRLAECGGAHG